MPKVLVIEDTEEMRTLLKSYLERMLKYEVIEASDGLEGIKLAALHLPDVIVLDLMMPVAGGDLTLGFIRSTTKLKKIPVIVSSAHPNAHKIAQQLGADYCLAKPFDLFTLKATIEKLLATPPDDTLRTLKKTGPLGELKKTGALPDLPSAAV